MLINSGAHLTCPRERNLLRALSRSLERRGILMASDKVQFSDFNEYFHDFHPHLMFYSWNGAGKTTLAGKTGLRTVLLDCGDAGVVTLKNADRSKLKIIRIKSCF